MLNDNTECCYFWYNCIRLGYFEKNIFNRYIKNYYFQKLYKHINILMKSVSFYLAQLHQFVI